jgi:hypothetical protein
VNHFAGHRRQAFLDWLDAGMPPQAEIEVNYEPEQVDRLTFLWDFIDCTDVIPKDDRIEVAELFGFEPNTHWRVATFGAIARELTTACEDGLIDPMGTDWPKEIADKFPPERRSEEVAP